MRRLLSVAPDAEGHATRRSGWLELGASRRPLEPFLKWPGGKRWLIPKLDQIERPAFDRYVEPFLGGGAMFFAIHPRKALLADTNEELINAYKCLRRSPLEIETRLQQLHRRHSSAVYYHMRSTLPKDNVERAIRFIYLNRTCFNGIYRVNRLGEFNVPIGSKSEVAYARGYLGNVSRTLKKASFRVADFERITDETGQGDLLFVDPPYTVMHNHNNFVKYNAHLFSWDDQVRLAESLRKAVDRGAKVMLSNADHASIRELYKDFGTHWVVGRATVLAAGSKHRCATTELLVTSFA